MLFNSLQFALFFPLVTALYFALPHRWRWLLLLTASCCFYMAFVPIYILILGFTIVVDYAAGILIERAAGPRRRLYLVASIIANVGTLAVFKYYNFFVDSLHSLAGPFGVNLSLPTLSLLLPIGLSFHTFQAMSYTIEVYRGHQQAERHFGIYALYVMFYPQLVAGPIERPGHMLHQFREEHRYDYNRVTSGLKLMAWGIFKKVVIADRLAQLVSRAYDNPAEFAGAPMILATVCFAFQIYCDFSGYSDIALGSAEVMGFRLMQNFDNPYGATSVTDFWKRWHISLSTWLRDYVFLPISYRLSRFLDRDTWMGVRHDVWVYGTASMLTMLLSGLWHGAAWKFVVWGGLHGVYLATGFATKRLRKAVVKHSTSWVHPRVLTAGRILFTFALVCIGWVFFRASSLGDAGHILWGMAIGAGPSVVAVLRHEVPARTLLLGRPLMMVLVSVPLLVMLWVEAVNRRLDARKWIARQPAVLRWSVYYLLAMTVLLLGQFETEQPFIYFQF